jgi:hypothetical protein
MFGFFFRRFIDRLSMSPRGSIDQTIQAGDRSSTTPLREREYQFVSSQNDLRWISYHAPSMSPAMAYAQNTVAHPQEYYYDPHSGTGQNVQQQQQHQPQHQQQQAPSYGMQNHLYHHHHHHNSASYFFDIPDPSLENFQLSQHMMSTSSSRTFLPDD